MVLLQSQDWPTREKKICNKSLNIGLNDEVSSLEREDLNMGIHAENMDVKSCIC